MLASRQAQLPCGYQFPPQPCAGGVCIEHTLLALGRLQVTGRYQLLVNGSTGSGLADRFGNSLDGDGDGTPGGDVVQLFGRTTGLRDTRRGRSGFPASLQAATFRRRPIG